jgi:hypothetical protein
MASTIARHPLPTTTSFAEGINMRQTAACESMELTPSCRFEKLAKLVRDTLPLCGKQYVETVAVMARYNPFFEHGGMRKIAESKPDKTVSSVIEKLKALGFNPLFLSSEKYNLQVLISEKSHVEAVRGILSSVHSPLLLKFANSHDPYERETVYKDMLKAASVEKLAKMLRTLAVLAQTKVYLV